MVFARLNTSSVSFGRELLLKVSSCKNGFLVGVAICDLRLVYEGDNGDASRSRDLSRVAFMALFLFSLLIFFTSSSSSLSRSNKMLLPVFFIGLEDYEAVGERGGVTLRLTSELCMLIASAYGCCGLGLYSLEILFF